MGASTSTSSGAGLLAGSYRSEFGRLSVGGKTQIVNRESPVIAGKARVGSTLTVLDGTWKPAVVALTYAWFADEKAIAGADEATYSPDASVVGRVVSVRVTASKRKYRPVTVIESAGKVKAGRITSESVPQVLGAAKVGKKLIVKPGRWSVAGVSLSYEWRVGDAVVSTKKKCAVPKKARNQVLEVTVSATKDGYRTATATAKSKKVR